MSPRSGNTSSARRVAAVAAVFAGMLACKDAPLASAPAPVIPRGADLQAGMISGSVDAAGLVSFDPIGPAPAAAGHAPGISAAIYGDQNVTVRLYSSDFQIDSTSTPGTKKWSFKVGLRNYLSYPIGSNQGAPQPDDTLGVYVAIVEDPIVTSTSGKCTGSKCKLVVANADGVGAFTATGQKYFYWRERLAAKQPAAGADTTSTRRLWTFSGPAAITGFRFVVMVNAAWPPPHDASWNVFYDATTDSLPDSAAEPRWKTMSTGGLFSGPGTESWSTAGLLLTADDNESLYMYRSDSLGTKESAYIEARLEVNGDDPVGIFGLQGSGRLAAVAVADGEVGFVDLEHDMLWIFDLGYQWTFVGSTHELRGNGGRKTHTYRLRKFGADSVRLEVDGARVLGMKVSQLPQASGQLSNATAFFGASGTNGGANSTWSHVTYNFGATQP